MRKSLTIIFVILLHCSYGKSKNGNLIAINKNEFYAGKIESTLERDSRVYKSKGILYLPNCKALKDNKSDEDFYKVSYLGDLTKKFSKKIIKKTLYNGNLYIVIETKNKCKVTTLLGRPHVFDSYIINFNDSETTDSNKLIEIWEWSEVQILKKRDIHLKQAMYFVEVRINNESKALLLKDNMGNFWKVVF